MVATAIYSMVLWKETAFPLCRALENGWMMMMVWSKRGNWLPSVL